MDNYIDRQAAIDAIEKKQMPIMRSEFLYDQAKFDGLSVALNIITELPSAQPEIIVCEDCKWRMSENRKTTSLWLPCRALVTPDEFSCIYAERREVTE